MERKSNQKLPGPSYLGAEELAIREQSKSWSAEEWESYLATLDVGLKESLSSKTEVSSRGLTANVFEYAATDCPDDVLELVERLVAQLSKRQQFVLRNVFWDGKSERQIAKMLGIGRSAVYDLKKRALKNLRKHAQGVLAKFPIVEAQIRLMELETEASGENPAA
jgi:DNA-directed RNA polymerase specialized sigma subunit